MAAASPYSLQDWREGLDGLANQHRPKAAAHCLRACLGELTGGALVHLYVKAGWSILSGVYCIHLKHSCTDYKIACSRDLVCSGVPLLSGRLLSWQAPWLKLRRESNPQTLKREALRSHVTSYGCARAAPQSRTRCPRLDAFPSKIKLRITFSQSVVLRGASEVRLPLPEPEP